MRIFLVVPIFFHYFSNVQRTVLNSTAQQNCRKTPAKLSKAAQWSRHDFLAAILTPTQRGYRWRNYSYLLGYGPSCRSNSLTGFFLFRGLGSHAFSPKQLTSQPYLFSRARTLVVMSTAARDLRYCAQISQQKMARGQNKEAENGQCYVLHSNNSRYLSCSRILTIFSFALRFPLHPLHFVDASIAPCEFWAF